MEPLYLKDKNILPTEDILENALGESYTAFKVFESKLTDQGINLEWNYYNDGKAWLCKMLFKKKNLGWLYVYDKYFKVSCFFMEKHLEDIDQLDISSSIKEDFLNNGSTGKLKPMTVAMYTKELPMDVMTMILFKKGLK